MPKLKVVFRDCNMPTTHSKYQSYPAKYILNYADALIAQTKEMKQEMAAFYHVNPEKITVINNPIDKTLIHQRLKETYQYPSQDCTHYIAVARIAPNKDYRTLIKAFATVLKQEPSSRLEIVGNPYWDKSYKRQVDKTIEKYGIGEYITFHGIQDNPFKYIEAADVFVLSSIHEGLPNVMLEAMYLGKPVVVTRSIPYIAQVIHDGVNGYTVPVGSYSELAEAMMQARKLCIKEKFIDLTNSDKQVVGLFNRVLKPKCRNVILSHLKEDVNTTICLNLERQSGKVFETIHLKMPHMSKIKSRIKFMLLYALHAFRLFTKRKHLRIIISWSDYVGGMLYACLCRFFNCRKSSIIILMAFIYNGKKQKGVLNRIKKAITRYAVCSRYVDYLIVFSKCEIIHYHELLGIPEHKIKFFPLSKDMTRFQPKVLPVKDERYIFSVGSTNRDYPFLIKTLDGCGHRVHIACNTLTENMNTENITIHDNMYGDEMQQYMYNSYCVVIPLKGERIISSGQLVLLQAMYMKKPIICTRGSCIADYLKDGYNALLVDNNKEDWLCAVEKLYKDKTLYQKLVENGYNDYMNKHRTECLTQHIATLIEGDNSLI